MNDVWRYFRNVSSLWPRSVEKPLFIAPEARCNHRLDVAGCSQLVQVRVMVRQGEHEARPGQRD